MMSKSLVVRLISFFLVLTLGVATLAPMSAQAETLDELLRRQAELKRKEEQNRKALEQKKREASNLRELIGDLDGDISYTSSRIQNTEEQIAATNSVINLLIQDIQKQQTELDALSAKLKGAYVNLYQLSQTSTMELLLQSPNLEEALSQAEYIQAIQTDLRKNIDTVNALKTDLEKKKTDSESQKASLETLRQELDRSRSTLTSQKNQKNYLLNQTQGEQAQYEELLKKLSAQQEQLGAEIYEARRRASSGENVSGGSGGYPWANEPNPYAVDPWLFYKRQCTSFAAWKFQSFYGQVFYNTRPGNGSAWNWPALAADQGYRVSTSPRVNSIVSWPINNSKNMPYGHVAWVIAVNGNGTIDVEEYNWTTERGYSKRTNVNPSYYGSARYIYP